VLTIHPNFITDNAGNKISAVLPIKEFNSIIDQLEELEDIRLYDESKNDNSPAVSRSKALQLIEEERRKLNK